MDNSKELREKRALSRLFKLTVIGSVLIVVVYSVYYYSNAHKYTRSNIIRASETKSTLVNVSLDTVVAKENLVFSDNLYFAKVNALNGWKYQGASSLGFTQNPRTTVGLSGLMENGFFEAFNAEMKRHFHSIPPIDLDRNKPGMVVKSIQFEHFVFPYHAMIRWDRRPGVKTFSFYKDSIKGTFLTLPGNGFSWLPDQGESRLFVQPCKEGDSIAALVDAMFNTKGTSVEEPEVVRMPIVDFDLLYTERKPPVFKRNGEVQRAATSTGEVKLLIGPSLKQGNVYEVDTSRTLLHIKPPFIVALTKEAESKPYFIALIANEELLLK